MLINKLTYIIKFDSGGYLVLLYIIAGLNGLDFFNVL